MQTIHKPDSSELKGAWILVVLLLITGFVQYNSSFEEYVEHALGVPEGSLGEDPPFHYLRGEVVQGICSGTAALLGFLLVALTWNRFQPFSGMALWMTWLWQMPTAADALFVYWQCPHLFDVNRAVSGWKTFEEALNDPMREAVRTGNLCIAMILAGFAMWHWRRTQRTGSIPTPFSLLTAP